MPTLMKEKGSLLSVRELNARHLAELLAANGSGWMGIHGRSVLEHFNAAANEPLGNGARQTMDWLQCNSTVVKRGIAVMTGRALNGLQEHDSVQVIHAPCLIPPSLSGNLQQLPTLQQIRDVMAVGQTIEGLKGACAESLGGRSSSVEATVYMPTQEYSLDSYGLFKKSMDGAELARAFERYSGIFKRLMPNANIVSSASLGEERLGRIADAETEIKIDGMVTDEEVGSEYWITYNPLSTEMGRLRILGELPDGKADAVKSAWAERLTEKAVTRLKWDAHDAATMVFLAKPNTLNLVACNIQEAAAATIAEQYCKERGIELAFLPVLESPGVQTLGKLRAFQGGGVLASPLDSGLYIDEDILPRIISTSPLMSEKDITSWLSNNRSPQVGRRIVMKEMETLLGVAGIQANGREEHRGTGLLRSHRALIAAMRLRTLDKALDLLEEVPGLGSLIAEKTPAHMRAIVRMLSEDGSPAAKEILQLISNGLNDELHGNNISEILACEKCKVEERALLNSSNRERLNAMRIVADIDFLAQLIESGLSSEDRVAAVRRIMKPPSHSRPEKLIIRKEVLKRAALGGSEAVSSAALPLIRREESTLREIMLRRGNGRVKEMAAQILAEQNPTLLKRLVSDFNA